MDGGTLILTCKEVESLVSIREAIPLVEEAFRLKAVGKVRMPPKVYVELPEYNGDLRVMPCYIQDKGILAVKIVTVYPLNPSTRHLPTVLATIAVLDKETGEPLAIMDGTWITLVRTSAAGAVAVKWLAPSDARILAVVGAGRQGYGQIEAILQVSSRVEELRIYDIRAEASEALASKFRERIAVVKPARTTKEAVEDADIVVTATPSRKPIIDRLWVKHGVHFNCIGADAPGKQELDPAILRDARIFVDDLVQAIHSGEVNVPIATGILRRDNIVGEIGEVIAGVKPGRLSRDELTVFVSTGLAIQDAIVAGYVYRKALEKGIGVRVDLAL
ncbi:MAG: ornithine cyclodeaminase family protein [Candidatus Bathyarchaeia archaeon]